MTAATYSLTRYVLKNKPDFILQAGIAGSLDKNLLSKLIVGVRSETIGDLGVYEKEKFNSVFEMKLAEGNSHPWKDGKLVNTFDASRLGLLMVGGVTVNEISTRHERISYYREQLEASVESMEGAALHYVALMEKVPFLQVRALSNYIGERDKNRWNIDGAIKGLNIEVKRIIQQLLQ